MAALLVWPLADSSLPHRWALPLGLFLTSFGWWECYVEEEGHSRYPALYYWYNLTLHHCCHFIIWSKQKAYKKVFTAVLPSLKMSFRRLWDVKTKMTDGGARG